ncbi:hypothetical protein [Lactobacillus crispatus]|jgi:hypothetical protein|uniref:Uncharacterized protein n=1 Tax=Lactobacillus crispatus TaxID=47770 RepID=A0AAW8WL66_9LACO|nr:hypothetical protein [Lactobacillus crispatus]STX18386.1 Uncharacterised protein [Lactobacillus acidophilus]MCT7731189.1 hypothetical protein [Lactobacillus crispatus]MCT7802880.1 hypothetical protein [Lactobacillus crispatus]MCT7808067.1 hypothetical protein [Lactobacillus crispatus]MCT7816703.1 hypothetical protein [Lactobacillus crispatus]
MFEPKVTANPRDIYVYQTNLPNPYDLLQLTKISAVDHDGNPINLNSQHLVLDTSKVDYSQVGTYTVSMSVMDDELNMALDYLTIHVLSPEEADRINSQYRSQELEQKEQKPEMKPKRHKLGGLQPISREKGIRYLEKNNFTRKKDGADNNRQDTNNHVFDRTSTYLIIALVIASLIAFAYYMFF